MTSLDVSMCSSLASAVTEGTRKDEKDYWLYQYNGAELAVDKDLTLIPAEPSVPVEINAVNFPDANFRSYVSETFDTDSEDRKSTRLNSSHPTTSRMPSSA